jgi:hypothetical protein
MARITLSDLKAQQAIIQSGLIEKGFSVDVKPYFAYGSYAYLLNFTRKDGSHAQIATQLGTKVEAFAALETAYYKALALSDEYK